jgi:tetratricopeptide (TPR) repeat protein
VTCKTACALFLLGSNAIFGQEGRTQSGQYSRQALSCEEFDAYLEVMDAQDPATQIQEASVFEHHYPNSELLVYIYEYELSAHRRLNHFREAVRAANLALSLTPDNTKVLLTLAQMLAASTQSPDLLLKAQALAERSLEEISKIKVPRSIPCQHWKDIRTGMQSQAHAANGVAARNLGKLDVAIRELQTAIALDPHRDGTVYFYLGKVYESTKHPQNALAMFRIAHDIGPEDVRRLAAKEISKLQNDAR